MKFIAPLASDDDDIKTPWVFAPKAPISLQHLLDLLVYPVEGAKVLSLISVPPVMSEEAKAKATAAPKKGPTRRKLQQMGDSVEPPKKPATDTFGQRVLAL
eukprot:3587062-Pyramimonas_sp.AAC.1